VDGILVGLDHDPGYLHSLAHYPEYDYFTFGHVIRVGLLSMDVAMHTTQDPELLRRIGLAALLHDVGKSRISWEVLHKKGPLTPDERREMQRHPVLGAGILLSNRESDPLSVAAAIGHHRTPDGGGYPWTCEDYQQGVVTRLVKICDVFEALTAIRPYKAALPPAKAYRVMLSMRSQFDEALLQHFIRVVGLHPPGTRVRLDDGSVARVLRQTSDFSRPRVEILERDGGAVPSEERKRIDLSLPEPGGPTCVLEALASLDAVALAG
jgi:HD-GYP domain-containing protein (c-di-GMP phosphodiesterase class II)